MIDLTGTSIATNQQLGFHIDNKLIAIHGINIVTGNNLKSAVSLYSIQPSDVTFEVDGDWTGYTGFICVNDEIMYVTNADYFADRTTLAVNRGQYRTKIGSHTLGQYVYTITIFKNILSYEWSQSIGVSDRDLFTTDISNGRIILDDLSQNWNKLYSGKLYNFKRNKEVFIWEGCNEELVKVWEGLTKDKNDSSENNEITIEITDYFNKFADEPISPVKIYNDIRPKELLESLFTGYTASYIGNTTATDYFKIFNISTNDFSTHRDFLNYICKEYAIRLLFRKDKIIHISSDIYPSKITPIATIQKELIKINNDSSGNIIINNVTGTYKERKPLKDISYTSIRYRQQKSFTGTIDIIASEEFKTITLTNLKESEINTMSYQEYQMIQDTTNKTYMCKLADITKVGTDDYTIILYAGIDKVSKWNQLGRLALEGNISITNFTLYWSYDELPIIWKYGRNIDSKDTTSNLMFPIVAGESYEFYIDSFGVGDTSNSKFSGIISGFDDLIGNTYTNTSLYYNQEYKQNLTVPIYLYSNKIASTLTDSLGVICIGSIDNSNITFKIDYSDIKNSLYKCTVSNTITATSTLEITPLQTMNGQRILKLSETNYNTCNIGDYLTLKEEESVILGVDNPKYQTYLSFKEARYLITSKIVDGTDYYITLNDYYPMAIGTEFTFIKYDRSNVILLNELYFRGNPIMEAETTYDFTHDESIEEYGKRDYTVDGKSIQKDDFLKITRYLKDTYNGITDNGIRNKIRSEIMRRVDLEAGDVIYITDSVYTKYSNQKALITKKDVKVDNNGTREETYEMITIGDYTITPETLTTRNILSWTPDVIPTYTHKSNEGEISQDILKQIDNNRIVLQDTTEGQIYIDEISSTNFYATTSTSIIITQDINTFELNMTSLAIGDYRNSLLGIGKEGVIKINGEYLSYKSLGYDGIDNTAKIQIIKRGIGGSSKADICSGLPIQFYKTVAKISAKGLQSTDILIGDGIKNTLKLASDDYSYLSMNSGQQQIGRITGITKTSVAVPDFDGFFFGNKELDNKSYYYYDSSKNISVFEGKYFNGEAYCSNAVEFIGALDTSKATITWDSVAIPNIFYGLLVTKVIVLESFNLSLLDSNHFSYQYYIMPSESINEITTTKTIIDTEIDMLNWGICLEYATNINNLLFHNMGSLGEIGGHKFAMLISSTNSSISNIFLTNIKKCIYGTIESTFDNIYLISYDSTSILAQNTGYKTIFNNIYRINKLYIMLSEDIVNRPILYNCDNIQDIIIDTYLYRTYANIRIFQNCKNINNIKSRITNSDGMTPCMFYQCNNISNFYGKVSFMMTSGANDYIFYDCRNISNINIDVGAADSCTQIMYGCSYISNVLTPSNPAYYVNCTKVSSDTVSWL